MRKLRFATILPILQVILAAILLRIGSHAVPPTRFDTLYQSTATMVCYGLNAPALVFRMLVYPVRVDQWLPNIAGYDASQLSFMLGVIVLWYLVGRSLDMHSPSARGEHIIGPGRLLSGLFLVILGSFLLYEAAVVLQNQSFNNRSGNIIQRSLVLLWAIFLIAAGAFREYRIWRKQLILTL